MNKMLLLLGCISFAIAQFAAANAHGQDPPSNDNFSGTIGLGNTLPFNTTGTNVDATTEEGEQDLGITGSTVWWFFESPIDGEITIDTFGSDYDTVLHIFDGFFVGAGPADLNLVTSNDDAPDAPADNIRASKVTFMATAGACYEIRVGGFQGAQGNIVVNGVEFVPPTPPSNDNFADTIFLGSLPAMVLGTNVAATTEEGEQNLDITDATVWWFFDAPGNGTATVDTFGSDFDTVLTIYDGFFAGATPADLNFVAENDQANGTNQSEVAFPVTEGACYEVRVGGFFGATGEITLNVSFEPAKEVLLGDVNCDGSVDLLDIAPFVDLISNGGFSVKADINEDGSVTLLDVEPFIDILAGG